MGNLYRPNTDYTLATQVVGDNGKVAFIPSFQAVGPTGTPVGGGTATTPSFSQIVNTKGQSSGMPTYVTSGSAYAGYATPTDFLVLSNPGTKTLLVTQAQLQIAQTAAAGFTLFFVRRSALNTGGSSTLPAIVSLDSTNAAATGVATLYTAAPTTSGTASTVFTVTATTTTGGIGTIFGLQNAARTQTTTVIDLRQPITIRPNESLALNSGGVALPTGFAASYFLEWVEI